MSFLTVDLVMNGSAVDQDASKQAFADALSRFVSEHETEQETIGATFDSVFDRNPGQVLAKPILVHMVLQALNVQSANYKSLEKRALKYISDNTGEGGLFTIVRGPKGGVARTSDLPTDSQ